MAIQGARHGLRTRGTFNVNITLDGNWFKFNELVTSTPVILAMAGREAQKRFAMEYRDKVKENIANGGKRFGYKPLSWKYLRNKIRVGGPSGLLVWSRTMLNSVEIISNRANTSYGVGIPKGKKRPNYPREGRNGNRLQVHEYANILEQGNRANGVVSRPVFSDTFRYHMKGKKGLKRFIEVHIMKKFGIRGFIVNKI